MTQGTPLDHAVSALLAGEEDTARRLTFYERLSEAELYLLLDAEPTDDRVRPRLFPVDEIPYALVFDTPDRLAAFAEGVVPYVALSGRMIAGMLAGQGVGLGLNLGDGAPGYMVPPAAVAWLVQILGAPQLETSDTPTRISAPVDLDRVLLSAIDRKLALAVGRARCAYLVQAHHGDGRSGLLLSFVEALPGAQDALGRLIAEAVAFMDPSVGGIDVGFVGVNDPIRPRLERVGLCFDLSPPEQGAQSGPGRDPDTPPRLV